MPLIFPMFALLNTTRDRSFSLEQWNSPAILGERKLIKNYKKEYTHKLGTKKNQQQSENLMNDFERAVMPINE